MQLAFYFRSRTLWSTETW